MATYKKKEAKLRVFRILLQIPMKAQIWIYLAVALISTNLTSASPSKNIALAHTPTHQGSVTYNSQMKSEVIAPYSNIESTLGSSQKFSGKWGLMLLAMIIIHGSRAAYIIHKAKSKTPVDRHR